MRPPSAERIFSSPENGNEIAHVGIVDGPFLPLLLVVALRARRAYAMRCR